MRLIISALLLCLALFPASSLGAKSVDEVDAVANDADAVDADAGFGIDAEITPEEFGILDPFLCPVCRWIANLLGSNPDADHVSDAIRKACKKLPRWLERPCRKFFAGVIGEILDEISGHITEEKLCGPSGLDYCN